MASRIPSHAEVVIVGAGPAGLAAALALVHRGIRPIILDSLPEAQNSSRATIVHALTLEELERLGVSEDVLASGTKSNLLTFRDQKENLITNINFSSLQGSTKYPHITVMPQHRVEAALRKRLEAAGVQVHRGATVVTLRSAGDMCEIVTENGEVVKTRYVVAGDGARSTVRKSCGIPFIEPRSGLAVGEFTQHPSAHLFVLADVEFEDPLPSYVSRDEVLIMLTAHGPFIFMPLKDPSDPSRIQFRVASGIAPHDEQPARRPDAAYFQRVINKYGPGSHRADGLPSPRVKSLTESSCHRVVSALAGTFYARAHGAHVLLVGDAGHRHSPAGGQGMNLGICDGVNAGKAIADHIAGAAGASDEVLQQYGERRRSIASEVINVSETLDGVEFVKNSWHALVRDYAMWFLLSVPPLNSRFAYTMSGIQYRDK